MGKKFLDAVRADLPVSAAMFSVDELAVCIAEQIYAVRRPINTTARAALGQFSDEEADRFREAAKAALQYFARVTGASPAAVIEDFRVN
jgi:hypothetical protein